MEHRYKKQTVEEKLCREIRHLLETVRGDDGLFMNILGVKNMEVYKQDSHELGMESAGNVAFVFEKNQNGCRDSDCEVK